jgi:hypothetical protein
LISIHFQVLGRKGTARSADLVKAAIGLSVDSAREAVTEREFS